ncbi:single-stranded DNA-binding protein [Leuconostoc mesenteroides]|jgi:single-strand DNA-binding protein|uniref:Single-stranded DNA-binding protein n=1 Tax=Leuconostoc mesenteroides subsp. mesenteroides (strain ATCC 8293 / DSM 20343 / BCRC 11652 / CCM 1803 / JCM 6124 / NCDO 523 / NBRC 100496 / NCIMB 8023 / NCTC 12954 / NRRL B-1118 / 37Y) TaxID=203120 RepID=Q03WR1_LEUMM|nr:single-stranded DNA-binding protein [Leuconostoc mesenteroides]ABJ62361.1 Single-stranded DNA-binding protein [Leuconostoc mesenteroides subsp. mesenteroides ATCC 8293]MCJ2158957.1 single-stranded DNA-binding protein [Leuconostoc mesenteroides]MCM6835618.1 single-stranded DNA-binding protein [Leuconostoc mesenteroides]MCT3042727.1 single-stranded DNA-binding protein [Leuconostoc mesenteroides]MDG9747228.1 single-stranded DNA-binding protein [Leuconostoc mesenteroides]
MQINHHVGRLVRDVNFTVRGEKETKIAYFKLAMNDLKDGKATYIDYVAFNKTAELILDYVTDIGQVVEVEFVMRNHNYTDKKKGQKVYAMQNQVTKFRIYKSNPSSKNQSEQHTETDNDLPPYPDFSSNAFEYVEG